MLLAAKQESVTMGLSIGRRAVLAASSMLPLARAGGAQAEDRKITLLTWGTNWALGIDQIAANFTRDSGISVELVTQTVSGESLVKLQAMKGHPTVDVWFTTSSVAERAVTDHDLFAALPADKMSNWNDVAEAARHERWVGGYGYPLGIVWRPDMVSKPITSWEDLWDKSFANKIGLPGPTSYQARMILTATLLAGGSIDNIEPGLQKLRALKDNVAFWYTSDAQARKALAQGDIALLVAPPAGAKMVRDQGAKVEMICPKPATGLFDVMTLLNGPKQEMGAAFINYVINQTSQEIIANTMQNAPVNTHAELSPILKAELPKPGDSVFFDETIVNKDFDGWVARFNQVVLG
jgi:putative spermidine/putrescine transport system substrate-binding protein